MLVETDVAVIGGGIVGVSIAYGLKQNQVDCVVLDEGDGAIRASRGNFGLVWVQGKGLTFPAYTDWTMRAAQSWPELSNQLKASTGIDVALEQKGGLFFCKTSEELQQRADNLEQIKSKYNGEYEYEVLNNNSIRNLVPEIGPDIAGATYSKYDGQADPLALLQALHRAYRLLGGHYCPDNGVLGIDKKGEKFILKTKQGQVIANRIVLASGLGNATLGDYLGRHIPIKPIRGQIMITERMPRMFHLAMEQARQMDNGTIMIGSSWEDVGFDLNTTYEHGARMANAAIEFFPILKSVRVIRSWAALRVISPDASPIYDEIVPGAFLVTCHSGVSLAAIHAMETAIWIADGQIPDAMKTFGLDRFNENKAAALKSA
jgi:glycine/D-amino acid oxidase-like deaminating enzyme